ncbi:carboxylesterase/lipase family protein [Arthrobacter sp. 35W]|uniref:carboxylesterase/lipase family protein n=1 Tax=Arthrobacter sp. 35W TaxID=1132441 RepID=UPI00041582C5|nr:carboxylesterase family protein [Arthrobacter sp. 35W]
MSENTTTVSVRATVSGGVLEGVAEDGVQRFLGVPYAAAPFGAHRFARPAPAPSWEGPRDATRHGPTSPQSPYPGRLGELMPSISIPGEEILNVAIWAPVKAAAPLPVMVWFHGGSLSRGANALPVYDGTAFARDGVVLVAVNYRLGAEGFSVLDGAPLNLGLLDQIAALEWVQREIAAFGGDPAQVVIFGESAGGNTVAALLGAPAAQGLFARAIIQSGPLVAAPPAAAARITASIAKHLGIPATREAFAAVEPAALVAAQDTVTAGTTPITGGLGYSLAIDGGTIPQAPLDALTQGAAAGVPLLIGTTTEEYRLWFLPSGLVNKLGRLHLAIGRRKAGVSGAAVRVFKRNRPGASPGILLGAIATDLLLREPANRVADARLGQAAPTYLYEFGWRSPVDDLGAAHALELGFVFDTVDTPDARSLAGPNTGSW